VGRGVLLVVLVGCRINFDLLGTDDAIDARPPHDEDGDGVLDSDDVCPHVPDPMQADFDGDRVGDVCDPQPSVPAETLVYFDPLVDRSGFTLVTGLVTETGESLHVDATIDYLEMKRALPFQFGVIEVAAEITDHPTVAQHQFTVSATDDILGPHHYVEVYESGTSAGYTAVSLSDGTTFTPVVQSPMTSGLHTGMFTLRLRAVPQPTTLQALARWEPTEMYTPGMNIPSYTGGAYVVIGALGVVFDLKYVVVIATAP